MFPQRNLQQSTPVPAATPVPQATIAPSIVPPDADALAQTIERFHKDGYMNRARYEELKALSEKHDLPVETMLGKDSPLSPLYHEHDATFMATNSVTSAPVVGMRTINPDEQWELLQGEGYNFDPNFPGWLMKDNGTTQYGMSTNYVGPNNERNQRTVVNGVTYWYQQDASGNRGQLLSQINADGTYGDAGTAQWDGALGKWVPRTQVPVNPAPPEKLVSPVGSIEPTGDTVPEPPFDENYFWQNR